MRLFIVTLVYASTIFWMTSPSEVLAHGKLPDVQKFCEKQFNFNKNSLIGKIDKVDYFYEKKKRQWYCRYTFPHFQKGVDYRYKAFDPGDACAKTRGTKLVHYHKGTPVTSINSMHCGIVDGTVARNEGIKTKLSLCNKSQKPEIYAAYAYWVPASSNTQKGWNMTGWYKIEQGKCRNLQVTNRTYDADIYLYAEGGDSIWGGKEAKFCVHSRKGFTIERADVAQCANLPYKRVPTTKLYVKPGNNNYNFL